MFSDIRKYFLEILQNIIRKRVLPSPLWGELADMRQKFDTYDADGFGFLDTREFNFALACQCYEQS